MRPLGTNVRVWLGRQRQENCAWLGRERARVLWGSWHCHRCRPVPLPCPGPQPGSTNQVTDLASPAQPGRWACARFGPVPGLDGVADMLRAVVSKGRFRGSSELMQPVLDHPGTAASSTATAARDVQQGSAPAQASGGPRAGAVGCKVSQWIPCNACHLPSLCGHCHVCWAVAMVDRQAAVRRRRTCASLLPGALYLFPGGGSPLTSYALRL